MPTSPFVWKAKKDQAISHLIGTVHFRDLGHVAQACKPYLRNADKIYFEHTSETALKEEQKLLPNGQTIDTLLSDAERKEVYAFFTEAYHGILTEQQVRRPISKRKLWDLELTAASIGSDKERDRYDRAKERLQQIYERLLVAQHLHTLPQDYVEMGQQIPQLTRFIDAYERRQHGKKIEATEIFDHVLLAYAREMGKDIEAVDLPGDYVRLQDSVSLEAQKALLLDTVRHVARGTFPNSGSEAVTIADVERMLDPGERHAGERINNVHHARTALWYKRTKEPLEKGNILIVTGVGHIVTDRGYVTLLQRDGFTVERIS